MHYSHHGSRYSRWDGTQYIDELTADDLMKAMSDELLRDGDLMNALRRLFWEGIHQQDGAQMPGVRDLVNQVRLQRQEQLQQYDLGSILEEIRERLADIVDTERAGIDRRLEQSKAAEPGARDQPLDQDETNRLREMLEQMASKRNEQLDNLPNDPAGQIKSLQEYDFLDPEAQRKFQELIDELQQQVLDQTFQGMQQALSEMTPEQIDEMTQMLSDLNDMLEERAQGREPDFERFMHKWGHMFGPDVQDLDDLLEELRNRNAAMQQLMGSMSPEQRSQLQSLMQGAVQDPDLQQQMSRLSENLGQAMRPEDWRRSYQFSGDQSLSLNEATRLMDQVDKLDQLEKQLKEVRDWNDFAAIDDQLIRDALGQEAQEHMDQLSRLTEILEEAGLVKKNRRGFELTAKGVRKIGEKALNDIFFELKRDRIGQHEFDRTGGPGERIDTSKPYEFGDPFLLDLPRTVMNAVQRGASGMPLKLEPNDFEVYRSESVTRSSTVLMIDMSRSMFYSDCFTSAKRIALALDSLIRSKYPRDTLHIIGFSYLAEELKPTDLATLTWNEYQYGTNMQHGFQLARQILGREKGSNRQIIMITDGEPTAHLEQGHVVFNWPPMPATFRETLREVVRCTRDDITINTFMLERSPYMIQFVNDLMRINGGRVFASTPEHLGEYILVDYVANKKKWIG